MQLSQMTLCLRSKLFLYRPPYNTPAVTRNPSKLNLNILGTKNRREQKSPTKFAEFFSFFFVGFMYVLECCIRNMNVKNHRRTQIQKNVMEKYNARRRQEYKELKSCFFLCYFREHVQLELTEQKSSLAFRFVFAVVVLLSVFAGSLRDFSPPDFFSAVAHWLPVTHRCTEMHVFFVLFASLHLTG